MKARKLEFKKIFRDRSISYLSDDTEWAHYIEYKDIDLSQKVNRYRLELGVFVLPNPYRTVLVIFE